MVARFRICDAHVSQSGNSQRDLLMHRALVTAGCGYIREKACLALAHQRNNLYARLSRWNFGALVILFFYIQNIDYCARPIVINYLHEAAFVEDRHDHRRRLSGQECYATASLTIVSS